MAASFPHGNARQSNREYVRTQPHVLADIRSKAGSARNVYQTLVLNGPADVQQQTTATPRNIEQVRNVQKSQRNLSRLTHDALYNLHEFAADSDFVHRIVTHPDLSVIMYSPDIVSLFQTLLASDSHSAVHVLSYDTTFCLGDFYLSPLLFRNADFDPAPTIPLADYLLHERKTTDTHTDFFRHLRTVVPELLTCPKLIIVTDREQAITQSLKDTVPELKHFLCWNHVLQDCKRWLQQHGAATQTEVSYYMDTVRTLLSQPTDGHYKDALPVAMTKWSQSFSQFFVDTIHPVVAQLGRWKLRAYGLNDITGNQSESFNCVLKRLQEWREAPVDSMALCLFRLSQFHVTEVRRGRCGVGEFQLRSGTCARQLSHY